MPPRTFDLVLVGATGFTGKLVAAYLHAHAPAGLKWAISGRNAARLADVKAQLGPNATCGLIVTPEGDSMTSLCEQTTAVVSTAGPFAVCGEPLVAACVQAGTHYADITGETHWSQKMIDKYQGAAHTRGVILVSFCGFDSLPADLGTFYLAKHVRSMYGVAVPEVVGGMAGTGAVSGGTVASAMGMLSSAQAQAESRDPFLLFPSHTACAPPSVAEKALIEPIPDHTSPFWLPELSKYACYFPMSSINTRVVRRSAGIFAQDGAKCLLPSAQKQRLDNSLPSLLRDDFRYAPGSPFSYSEYMVTRSWLQAQIVSASASVVPVVAGVPGVLSLAQRYLPKPGEGPSEEQRAKHSFTYYLIGRLGDDKRVIATVKGGDGGYADTSRMLAEAGIALALKQDVLPGAAFGGGFLTPATAFGSVLIDALEAGGILKFGILRDDLAAAAGGSGSGTAVAAKL